LGVGILLTGITPSTPTWKLVATVMGSLFILAAALTAGGDRRLNYVVAGLAFAVASIAAVVYATRAVPYVQVTATRDPYPQDPASTLGGAKWDGKTPALRVIFQNLDQAARASMGQFLLRFDVPALNVVQLSKVPDVRANVFIEGFDMRGAALVSADGHAIPFSKGVVASETARVAIDRLDPQEVVELLVVPSESGTPRRVYVTGTYEADSREVLSIDYSNVGK
jgi:hypothetical protein